MPSHRNLLEGMNSHLIIFQGEITQSATLMCSHSHSIAEACYIIRPHRGTTYVDAAYCYRPSSVICHTSEPCTNGWTDRDTIWLRTQVGPGNHVLDGGPDPHEKGQFCGMKGRPIVKYRDILWSSLQRRLNRSRCRFNYGLGCAQGIMY